MRYITLLFLFIPGVFFSQTSLQGTILKTNSLPVTGASVVVLNLSGKMITYSITSDEGKFSIEFTSSEKKIILKISHMGYEELKEEVDNATNVSLQFFLKEREFKLDEIVIKNSQIRDTMRLATDSIGLTQRSTLRDILNKTEGFNVSENGGIIFAREGNHYYK